MTNEKFKLDPKGSIGRAKWERAVKLDDAWRLFKRANPDISSLRWAAYVFLEQTDLVDSDYNQDLIRILEVAV